MRFLLEIYLIYLQCFVEGVYTSWWYLGVSSSVQSTLQSPKIQDSEFRRYKCTKMSFLSPRQKDLCVKYTNILNIVRLGASLGINECQHQFKNRRWNCTTFNTTNVFGNVLAKRSRERAYIYAVSSAGVMHSITRACAKGKLRNCGCDPNVRRQDTKGKFEWGGCSHHVVYGERLSADFTDSKEPRFNPDGLMNLWNNKAGRKAVKEDMKILCKCHGVSGSCSVKICWRSMNAFRKIGEKLRENFDGASLLKMNKRRTKLIPVNKAFKRPRKTDLVYLEKSPSYCEHNPEQGILGTVGRECNRTSYGLEGCTLMCCGRGYHTVITEVEEDCNCNFVWCCHVHCKKCQVVVEKNYCN